MYYSYIELPTTLPGRLYQSAHQMVVNHHNYTGNLHPQMSGNGHYQMGGSGLNYQMSANHQYYTDNSTTQGNSNNNHDVRSQIPSDHFSTYSDSSKF